MIGARVVFASGKFRDFLKLSEKKRNFKIEQDSTHMSYMDHNTSWRRVLWFFGLHSLALNRNDIWFVLLGKQANHHSRSSPFMLDWIKSTAMVNCLYQNYKWFDCSCFLWHVLRAKEVLETCFFNLICNL